MELHITDDTEVVFSEDVSIQDVHLHDLSFVMNVEHDEDGNVERCELDLRALVRSQALYAAMEEQEYMWRKKARGYL